MFLFIVSLIAALIVLIAIPVATFSEDLRVGANITAIITFIVGGICLFFSMFYANGVGEAKVQVNSIDRTVVGTIEEPGSGFRAPWVDFVEFDLFSQELVYAGKSGDAPSYSGGSVNGAEVTVAVGGSSGGSTQGNVDISVTYSLDAGAVADIYADYRSQERFTKQVIEKTILSAIRSVPSQYSATEFRGSKRAEAAEKIAEALTEKLKPLGVEVDFVNIQDVRYPEEVEAALKDVEVANQKQQKAEAELRAATTAAQQKVVEAQAEADANAVLAASLTEPVLQQRYLDTLAQLSKGGNLVVVPEGFNGLVNVTK